MKILCIKLRELGDTVIWTSALHALNSMYPHAKLDILTLSKNVELLKYNPHISKIYQIPTRSGLALIVALFKLRAIKYDLVLSFHANSSLYKFLFLIKPKKLAIHHHSKTINLKPSYYKGEFLPVPRPGFLESALKRDYQLLEALKYNKRMYPTKIYISDTEKKWAKKEIKKNNFDHKKKIIALLPGASTETKRYPRFLFLELLSKLKAMTQYHFICLVDSALSQEWNLKEELEKFNITLYDNLSLRQFVSLLSLCKIAIANDSGPFHMAQALSLKTISLFGPSNYGDWQFYPKDKNISIRKKVDCRLEGPRHQVDFQYCGLTICSHHSCMAQIQPQEIITKFKKITSNDA